jgi:hypothetical protein
MVAKLATTRAEAGTDSDAETVAEKNIGYDGRLIFTAQEVDLDGISSAKLMYQTWLIADGD